MKKVFLIIMIILISYIGYELYIDENTFIVTNYNVYTNEDDLFRQEDNSNIRFA